MTRLHLWITLVTLQFSIIGLESIFVYYLYKLESDQEVTKAGVKTVGVISKMISKLKERSTKDGGSSMKSVKKLASVGVTIPEEEKEEEEVNDLDEHNEEGNMQEGGKDSDRLKKTNRTVGAVKHAFSVGTERASRATSKVREVKKKIGLKNKIDNFCLVFLPLATVISYLAVMKPWEFYVG
jgi:hypothetical protein